MVDTNSDPREVDYVIPANDDASKSVNKVVSHIADSVIEGLKKEIIRKKRKPPKKLLKRKLKKSKIS